MKANKIIILLFLIPNFSWTQTIEKDLLSNFKNNDTIIISKNIENTAKSKLDSSLVFKYLCGVKNECFNNPTNSREYTYYPLSKKEYSTYWLISYLVTDNYEYKIYIETLGKKRHTISRLNVYNWIGRDNPFLYSVLQDGKINIIRKIEKECDDEEEKKCFFTISETYKIDENFTPLITRDVINR